MDAFVALQELSRASSSAEAQSVLSGWTITAPSETALDDGGRKINTAIENPSEDLSIPLGSWTLHLVPKTDTGSPRIPISLVLNSDDSFRQLEIELARFELEADPDHLIAADLHTEPHTHLTPTQGGPPVRLLGPGFTLILKGDGLADLEAKPTGAAGGSDEGFPSARFEPPHFIIGGTDDKLGVTCDEVLLDLSRSDNPSIVDDRLPDAGNTWRGIHLKELGVYIGDGTEVGTWSGMAAMRDFFIGFDGTDLTGTFVAELVHYALENDPQVRVSIYYEDDDGRERLAADEGDADIPAPTGDRAFRRIRLEAVPNWDSAGFRPEWTTPAGVLVEEPLRRRSLNLGWVQVPPGDFEFTVAVTDHRVDTQTETRTVQVAEPAAAGDGAAPLTTTFEGILESTESESGFRPTNRLHMTLTPGEHVTLRARLDGGSGNATASLHLSSGFSLVSSTPDASSSAQSLSRPAGSNVYPVAEWVVAAPSSVPADPHMALRLSVDDGSTTLERRLRFSIEDDPAAGSRNFDILTYNDWRADPGIGLAHLRLENGLKFPEVEWTLDRVPVTPSLFSDATADAFFEPGATYVATEPIGLSNSASTVRPYLYADDNLWRLTGRVAPGTTAARAPIYVGVPVGHAALQDNHVRTFLSGLPLPKPVDDASAGAHRGIVFHYDCDRIQPGSDVCTKKGPESPSRPHADTNVEQARGFAALFRAIEEYGDEIESIALFAGASAEGEFGYNLDLSRRRAEAARNALVSPPSALVSAMSGLSGDESYSIPSSVSSLVNTLDSAGNVAAFHYGEDHAQSDPIDPDDRRVFAILRLKPADATAEIVRREYFVTLPGAPPPAETPRTPQKQLQDHPFRHSIFRLAHVEVELLRNQLVRLQIRLKLDLEAFNENDEMPPGGDLNELDGVTTFFLEMKRNPAPEPDEPEYAWEFVVLADPQDVDGFALLNRPDDASVLDTVGGPLVVLPPLTALAGGRTGLTGFLASVAVGEILTALSVLNVQTLVWRGIRMRLLHGNLSGPAISFAVDYTVRYHIDADLGEMIGIPLQLRTDPDNPIEISFRNVGVEVRFHNSTTVEFFYNPSDGFQLDVNDPGVFQLDDGIGRLLNVRRFRSGAGSPLWFEVELALALDTGVFSIDTLRIRVSLETGKLYEPNASNEVTLGAGSIQVQDFTVSLNKLGASVSVPGTFAGRGMLGISSDSGGGTTIEGEVDLNLIPLSLRIYGGLKIYSSDELKALYAYLGVEFAPGIPLGNTGAAIYGFSGLLGANMGRTSDDALTWFKGPPVGVTSVEKWEPARGNWAFGVGTVLGTTYDTGFSFNTKGAFIVEIPGPKLMLSTESNFLKLKPDVGSVETGTLLSVILLDFENKLFLIGIDFTYEKAGLMTFRVPTEAFFNLSDPSDWHIRFGQWSPESKRITLRLLEMWKAWGYLVLEGKGHVIPGHLDLRGICLAMGARIEIFWGSKGLGVYLEAYIEFHAGLQIDPILVQGSLVVGGELHLGPVSLGARGTLTIKAPDPMVIRGEICGRLKLWLFTIEGCASFTIGDGSAPTPAPPNPFRELTVIDRMTSAAVENTSSVPLDAVVHLVFNQDMIDARPDAGISVADQIALRNQVSGDLFYEYHLKSARIVRVSDSAVVAPIKTAWGAYTLPNAEPEEADSARTLRLLDWLPHSHARALDFRGGYESTLELLIRRLCERVPEPQRRCTTFDEEPLGIQSVYHLMEGTLRPVRVVALQSDGLGAEFIGSSIQAAAARVVPLVSFPYDGRVASQHCLRLPGPGMVGRLGRVSLREMFPLQNAGEPGAEPAQPIVDIDPRLGEIERERLERLRRQPAPEVDLDRIDIPDLNERIGRVARPPRVETPEPIRPRIPIRPPIFGARIGVPVPPIDAGPPPSAGEAIAAMLRESVREAAARTTISASALSSSGARTHGSTYQTAMMLRGLLFIRLPDLVQCDATFVLPKKLRLDGEAVFLDSAFRAVSEVMSLQMAPLVTSPPGTGAFSNHVARRITFGPPPADADTPNRASWLVVNPPEPVALDRGDPYAYLVDICGITYGEWKRWRDRTEDRKRTILELEEMTGIIGGEPAVSAQALLDPDTEYRVEASVDWIRFRDATSDDDDGASSSPYTLAGPFPSGTTAPTLTFRTMKSAPTEIRRYVLDHDPPGYEQPHYFGEPTEIRFASNAIDKLFAKFGKQLVARAKSDTSGHVLNQPLTDGSGTQFFPFDASEKVLFDALTEAACTSADFSKLFPKTVYTFPEDLMPNTGYTVTLIPRPLGEPGSMTETAWNDALQEDFDANRFVFRFDMRTSRFRTFRRHVEAYSAGPVLDLFGDDEAALNAALVAITDARSDEAVDALSIALFGGPIAVPATCTVARIWVPAGAAPDPFSSPPYRCRAVLLDGPEPLLKRRPDGSDRTTIEAVAAPDEATPFSGGTALAELREIRGARGARVLLTFAGTSPPPWIRVRITDRRRATDAPTTEEIAVEVGDTPGSFSEGGA